MVFDLDGTLWNTCASCAIAWNRVLHRHGIRFRPITDLTAWLLGQAPAAS